MDEAAENFMDKWLDANVSRKHDKLEEVVCDIEEAIADEINVIAAQLAKQ